MWLTVLIKICAALPRIMKGSTWKERSDFASEKTAIIKFAPKAYKLECLTILNDIHI
jgi:hypothetical protein